MSQWPGLFPEVPSCREPPGAPRGGAGYELGHCQAGTLTMLRRSGAEELAAAEERRDGGGPGTRGHGSRSAPWCVPVHRHGSQPQRQQAQRRHEGRNARRHDEEAEQGEHFQRTTGSTTVSEAPGELQPDGWLLVYGIERNAACVWCSLWAPWRRTCCSRRPGEALATCCCHDPRMHPPTTHIYRAIHTQDGPVAAEWRREAAGACGPAKDRRSLRPRWPATLHVAAGVGAAEAAGGHPRQRLGRQPPGSHAQQGAL